MEPEIVVHNVRRIMHPACIPKKQEWSMILIRFMISSDSTLSGDSFRVPGSRDQTEGDSCLMAEHQGETECTVYSVLVLLYTCSCVYLENLINCFSIEIVAVFQILCWDGEVSSQLLRYHKLLILRFYLNISRTFCGVIVGTRILMTAFLLSVE